MPPAARLNAATLGMRRDDVNDSNLAAVKLWKFLHAPAYEAD